MLSLKYFSYLCKRISIFFEKIYIEEYMNTTRILNLEKQHCGSVVCYKVLTHSLLCVCRGAKGTLQPEA